MKFYVGLHHPHVAGNFDLAFVSINALRGRKSDFPCKTWIMDSGAFTEISTHGRYRYSPERYATEIERWRSCGNMELAVAQDWMCEPWILKSVALSEGVEMPVDWQSLVVPMGEFDFVARQITSAEINAARVFTDEMARERVRIHQQRTVERYDALKAATDAPIMPVLQGYKPAEYLECLALYGERLTHGMRVGVGSICKRNSHPAMIEHILTLIKQKRPDLRLHGFGLKLTAVARTNIANLLYSADSMAWSFAARKEGRNANDWREAKAYEERIDNLHKPCRTLELFT